MKKILTLFILINTIQVFGQDVYSKYPCDSSSTYDILLSGAEFSGTKIDTQSELQNLIFTIENFKDVSGKYFLKFVINCDGSTKDVDSNLSENTIINQIIKDFMNKLATENNWKPAIHRGERVPHRKTISVTIKKGKIRELNL